MSVHPCPAPKCRDVDGNPVLTMRPMCDHHTGKVGQALGQMTRYYDACTAAMLPGQRGGGDDVRVTTSNIEAPIPIDVEARAAQEDMLDLLRTALGERRPRHGGNERPALTRLVVTARNHLDELLAADVTFGVEVLRLTWRVRSMLGLTRLVHRLAGHCPYCSAPLLTREDGSEVVACRGCGVLFSVEVAHAAGIDTKIEVA